MQTAPALELPQPVDVGRTSPRTLMAHNRLLEYFVSSPQRLAPHLALAAPPHTPRTAVGIARELIRDATPALTLDSDGKRHLIYRLGILFGPDAQYVIGSGDVEQRRDIVHTEAGRTAAAAAVLFAARWLTDGEMTERLMPVGTMRTRQHGTRLAILRHCLFAYTHIDTMADDLGKSKLSVARFVRSFLDRDIVTRNRTYLNASYKVTPKYQPAVRGLLAQVHGLTDPDYAHALRTEVAATIVGTPALYGALAHAALSDIAATRKPGR